MELYDEYKRAELMLKQNVIYHNAKGDNLIKCTVSSCNYFCNMGSGAYSIDRYIELLYDHHEEKHK